MTERLIFVFVHCAWHGPETWDLVIPLLSQKGYECHTLTYPSVNIPTPDQNMDPDTESIRKGLAAQLNAGKDVVLVMHSYGGRPGSEAVKYFHPQTGENGRGKIVRLVYISAFLPFEGLSMIEARGGTPPPHWLISGHTFQPKDVKSLLYNDFTDEEAAKWIKHCRPQSYGCMLTKTTFEPYRVIPSAYLHTVNDQGLPMQVQEKALAKAMENAPGKFDLIEKLPTGHMCILRMPNEVADFLLRAAGKPS